jgi:hypothetical protein
MFFPPAGWVPEKPGEPSTWLRTHSSGPIVIRRGLPQCSSVPDKNPVLDERSVFFPSGSKVSPLTTLPRRRLVALAVLALLVAACSRPVEGPKAPTSPEYSGEDALRFDDVLAPALFGFDLQARNPATDPKLGERVRYADYVMPVRVDSLSRSGSGYELSLSATGPALAGQHTGPIVLLVQKGSPSYAWVEGAGPQLAGSRMIVFGKTFRNGDGQIVHFRGEPDTPDMRKAIERDAALRLLR